MIDMPTAERDDGYERAIDGEAQRVGQTWQHDLFRRALPQNSEAGEVEFGIGSHGFAHEFRRVFSAFRQPDGADPRCAIGGIETEMPDLCRIDARENARPNDWRRPPGLSFRLSDPQSAERCEKGRTVRDCFLAPRWRSASEQATGRHQPGSRFRRDPQRSALRHQGRGCHGQMEKRALAVAKIVERSLAAGFIGTKDDFDLPDKFLKAQIELVEKAESCRCRRYAPLASAASPRSPRGRLRLRRKTPHSRWRLLRRKCP